MIGFGTYFSVFHSERIIHLRAFPAGNVKTVAKRNTFYSRNAKQKGCDAVFQSIEHGGADSGREANYRALNDAVISNGGALVRLGSKTVFTACLSAETADAIIAGITALPEYLEVTAQTPLGYYVSRPPADPDRSQAILHDFSKPLGQEAYKLTARASRADGLSAIAAKHPQCCLIPFSDGCWYRFAHKHATKPNAIRHLAACLNLDMAMFAAFGDDYNDEDMLRHCGIGIAMGNAAPQVKAAADYVCDTNDRDGIAKWLTEFVLKNTK